MGPLRTNCYVVIDDSLAVIIDPGWHKNVEPIINVIRSRGVVVDSIIATHGHFDHVAGVGVFKNFFGARFLMNKKDLDLLKRSSYLVKEFLGIEIPEPPEPDDFVSENYVIRLNRVALRIIETPGHTAGSISIIAEPARRSSGISRSLIFTGDTLFREGVGRIDFPESLPNEMIRSLRRIAELPRETIVYPGHGPKTTIDHELRNNIFLAEILGGDLI